MATESKSSILRRRARRRTVLGASLAAGSVAVAYAALGDKLGLLSDDSPRGDTAAIERESVKISHLLRRAGFGVTREEYDRYQALGLDATIDELVGFADVADDAALELANQVPTGNVRGANPGLWWLVRMANTKRPLQEKMTLFWHGLLTSQQSVVRDTAAMLAQNEFFRANAFARFPDILRGITMDRAMMVYLDMSGSVRRAPNENYARELMELFALGEGNYTEQDVREGARAFTGWLVPRENQGGPPVWGEPVFRPQQFDDGQKTFLGRTGNFRPDDIVDIVVEQPASASFIVRKLFEFFVYAGPDEETLAPFVDVYLSSDKSIGATVEAILRSDVFYSPRAYRAAVKNPIEYTVGATKALGLQAQTQALFGAGGSLNPRGQGVVTPMGQNPFEPPNVAGWPGGAAWLNSTTMFARLNFINAITGGAPPARDAPPPPALPSILGTAAQALAHYLPLVLDDNLTPESRRVLVEYAGGEDAALTSDKLRGLVYLILGSPQFHLA
jgi:uncharacterized protein (DUF1800 family)